MTAIMGKTIFSSIFLFLALAPPASTRLIDKTSAIVNSEIILYSDLQKFKASLGLRKEIDPFIAFFGYTPQASNKTLIDYLVQEKLIEQKFPATKEDIDEEIQSVERKNNLDLDGLKNILKSQGVSFEVYSKLMGISIAKRKLMDRELRPFSIVSEDEIKNYYYTNAKFIERKKKQKLLLSYNLSQIRIPGKTLANTIAEKLKTGEDFDAIANKYLDKGVRQVALGILREDSLTESIRDSLEGLKVGETTKPVRLGEEDDLYVIHKVGSISAPHDPVFEKEKNQIHELLFQKAMERQLLLWTEREKLNAYVHIPN